MISMGRAGYTNSSVGGRGGGEYKIVLRGKGAVWLLDRFYIKYPACFLHSLFYCFNSKQRLKKLRRLRTTNYGWTSVVLCLERWVESSKNVFMFSSQKIYFTLLIAGKLAVGIVKNCNVFMYTNPAWSIIASPLRQIQLFQILPLIEFEFFITNFNFTNKLTTWSNHLFLERAGFPTTLCRSTEIGDKVSTFARLYRSIM